MKAHATLLVSFAIAACGEPPAAVDVPAVVVTVAEASAPPPSAAAAATSSATGSAPPRASSAFMPDRAIVHEPCDVSGPGARGVDLNKDGRPDVFHVVVDGHEVCRAYDLDFDGHVDETRYFDASGAERRIERDFDGDGVIDHVLVQSGTPPRCIEFRDIDSDGLADDVKVIADCKMQP